MRPLAVAEGEGFKSLVVALDSTYQIPSRGHISTVLQKIYAELKVMIADELSSVTSVALTTDHWTSRAMNSHLCVSQSTL